MRNPELTDSIQIIHFGFVVVETKCAYTSAAQSIFGLYVQMTKNWDGRVEIVWRDLLADKIVDYHDKKH